jgi:energy-coupling factor transport system permease protein
MVPVLEDALERSIRLAAAMESKGYGRLSAVDPTRRRITEACSLVGVGGLCVGVYGVLDGTAAGVFGVPMLLGGAAASIIGLRMAGARVEVTRYRPGVWERAEWLVVASGLVAVAGSVATSPTVLNPSVQPIVWPGISLIATCGILAAALPALLSPPLPTFDRPSTDVPRVVEGVVV